jgi:hypothetical protein
MRSLYIWTLLGESDLDGSWTPRNEVGELPFPDSLQRFMNLSWVNISLNNVQD